jgi:transcriptional regulator with XRE-family HTH domain
MKTKNMNKDFSKNLKTIRKTLGLTQEEMAGKLHTTKQTIFRYERGDIAPGLNILQHLLHDFKINLNWLLNEEENTNNMFVAPKPDDYGVYEEDKKELDYLMDHIPFVRSAILKYFILYKHDNKEEIRKFLESNGIKPYGNKKK